MKTDNSHFGPVLLISFIFLATLSSFSQTGEKAKFFTQENSSYPFSLAVKAGDFVYVSGMIGTDKNGNLDPDFRKQAIQTMENIKARVEKLGFSMKDIVKSTVMIKDMSKWADFNGIYKTYFESDNYPARSAFGVAALAQGAEMEVEVILYSPAKSK